MTDFTTTLAPTVQVSHTQAGCYRQQVNHSDDTHALNAMSASVATYETVCQRLVC